MSKAKMNDDNSRDPQTYAIIGAAIEVHRVLGCGFLEAVYQEAIAKEFSRLGVPFKREVELPITYKDELLNVKYKADFVCYEEVIVELKALEQVAGKEKAQVINYLKATNHQKALLLNFGNMRLQHERIILSEQARA